MAARALMVLLVASGPVLAQNRRERLTRLMREAELKVEKAATEAEREETRDVVESYRHELGYRDAEGKSIGWSIGYQKSLIASLGATITEMEGNSKGGWGLLPLADDAGRAWRILAKALLERSDREPDWNERCRYGYAGMLLAHNAEVLDALLSELPKIEAVRKAVPEGDEHADRRRILNNALAGGAHALVRLCRSVSAGQTALGHGEIRDMWNRLSRIRSAAALVRGEVQDSGAEKSADEAAETAAYLERVDAVSARIDGLKASGPEMGERLAHYVAQVRFGLGVAEARPLAVSLLDHVERAVSLWESVAGSEIVSEGRRKQMEEELGAAVGRMGDRSTRDEGYRNIRDLENSDRTRRRLEGLPVVATAVKRGLWRGREWADGVLAPPGDDGEHQLAGKLRHVLDLLAWRAERLYAASKPADRYLDAAYRKGMGALASRLGAAAQGAADHSPESERLAWEAVNTINDLESVQSTDDALGRVGEHISVSDVVQKACGLVAARLFDADRGNDGAARRRLGDARDALTLVRHFCEAGLSRAGLAEAAKVSRGKYYAAYRGQSGRSLLVLKTVLEGSREERDRLRDILPLYQLTAECVILGRAEAEGDLWRCRVAKWVTLEAEGLGTLRSEARDRLGEVFSELSKGRVQDNQSLVSPIRSHELVLRTATAALLESRREAASADRLGMVLENLRRTSEGDPGREARQRWQVSWHVNQAMEACGKGYRRTGDYHAGALGRNNPLLGVALSVKGEGN